MTYLSKKKSIIFSLILTIIILAILLHFVTISDILNSLHKVSIKYILLGFFCHLSAYIFRTLVFYTFLKEKKINYFFLLSIHFIQNLFVQIFPANLGEFSFPILLRKIIPMSKSFSVLLLSRIISLILLLILFILSGSYLFNFHRMIKFKENVTLYLLLLIIILFVIFVIILTKSRLKKKILSLKILNLLYQKVMIVLLSIKDEILKMKNINFSLRIILYSFLSISSVAFFYIVMLRSQGIAFNFLQVIFVTSIGAAFMILPFKSIGGFGTTEGSLAIGFMLLNLPRDIAINMGFVIHIFALINVITLFIIGQIIKLFFKEKYYYEI